MGTVNGVTNLPSDPEAFARFAAPLINNMCDAINGSIEFDANILSQTVTVVFTVANADLAVAHKLEKTGVRYLVASKNVSCDVYTGAGLATSGSLYLRSTAPATVTLVLF